MAIFFIERAILIFANSIIEPFFGRIEQKLALSGSFYQRHPVDYKIFIFLGQPLLNTLPKIPSTPQFFWASHENNITRRSYLMAEIRINYPDINYSEVKLNREAYQEIVQLVQESKKRKRK